MNGEIEQPAGRDAATMKSSAAAARADVTRQVTELEEAQRAAAARLDAQRKALEAEFARKKRELDLQLAPLKAELARIHSQDGRQRQRPGGHLRQPGDCPAPRAS